MSIKDELNPDSKEIKVNSQNQKDEPSNNSSHELIEAKDYYIENGFYVFTAEYLKGRGYCCKSGCRHCPY
jgi:hypothetical protein